MPNHPMQPVILEEGVPRFKKNAIVRALIDICTMRGIMDMNAIAVLPFSDEDRVQFAQLIGYSVRGAGDLSYMPEELIAEADMQAKLLLAKILMPDDEPVTHVSIELGTGTIANQVCAKCGAPATAKAYAEYLCKTHFDEIPF